MPLFHIFLKTLTHFQRNPGTKQPTGLVDLSVGHSSTCTSCPSWMNQPWMKRTLFQTLRTKCTMVQAWVVQTTRYRFYSFYQSHLMERDRTRFYRCIQSHGITFLKSPLMGTEVGSCLMKNQSWALALFFQVSSLLNFYP
jgi:hypothetical protein